MQQNGSFDYTNMSQRQGSDYTFQAQQDYNNNNHPYQMNMSNLTPSNNNSFAQGNNNGSMSNPAGFYTGSNSQHTPTSPNIPISPSSQSGGQQKVRKMHNPYSTDKTTRMVGTPQSQRDVSSPSSPTLMGSQTFSNNNLGGPLTPQAHRGTTSPSTYTNNPYRMMNTNNTNNNNSTSTGSHVPLMENLTLPSATSTGSTSSASPILSTGINPVPAPLYNNSNTFGVSTTAPSQNLMSLKKPNTPPTEQNTTISSSAASSTNSASATLPPPPVAATSTNTSVSAQQQQQQSPLPTAGMTPAETYDYLNARKDELTELSRTAQGSSMLQSAIKSGEQCTNLIWECFEPVLGDLMLDANAGYVVRVLLDTVPRDASLKVCERITEDQLLAFSLCVHSLHTRRLVQSIMETVDRNFLSTVLINQCAEVAKTQQGCIVMQRALDHCVEKNRTRLVSAIASNVAIFASDPFANYVIQYLLDTAPREEAIPLIWNSIKGKVLELSCNKFASNVIEKFLILADQQSQHALIEELYNNDINGLCRIMQDSFGNYIVQATIARSSFADLQFIDEKLRPVLEMVPYGSKIAARLDRRLNNPHHHNNNNNNHNNNNNGNNNSTNNNQHNQMPLGVPAPASSRNNNNNGGQQQQQQHQHQRGSNNNNSNYQNNKSGHHNHHHHRGGHNNNTSNHHHYNNNSGMQQQQQQYYGGNTNNMQHQQYNNNYHQQQQAYSGVSSSSPTPAW